MWFLLEYIFFCLNCLTDYELYFIWFAFNSHVVELNDMLLSVCVGMISYTHAHYGYYCCCWFFSCRRHLMDFVNVFFHWQIQTKCVWMTMTLLAHKRPVLPEKKEEKRNNNERHLFYHTEMLSLIIIRIIECNDSIDRLNHWNVHKYSILKFGSVIAFRPIMPSNQIPNMYPTASDIMYLLNQ